MASKQRLGFVFLLSAMVIFLNISHASAAITLVYFIATVEQEDSVFLEWETGSETDISGFYIVRSTAISGPYERVSQDLIFAAGEFGGAYYNYTDEELQPNIYFYKLEIIPLDQGQSSDFSDSISIMVGNVPTMTVTLTQTITQIGQPSHTATVTRTGTQPTSTRTSTSASFSTPTKTRTPSGLPTTTKQFLAVTRTRTPTFVPTGVSVSTISQPQNPTNESTSTLPPLILPSPTVGDRQSTRSAAQTQTAQPTATQTATFAPRPAPALGDIVGWGGVLIGSILFVIIGIWMARMVFQYKRPGL